MVSQLVGPAVRELSSWLSDPLYREAYKALMANDVDLWIEKAHTLNSIRANGKHLPSDKLLRMARAANKEVRERKAERDAK